MKLKALLITIGAALSLGGIGLAAALNMEPVEEEAVPVKASAIRDSTIEIRFEAHVDWNTGYDDNIPYIHTWDDEGGTDWNNGYKMTRVGDNARLFTWSPSVNQPLYSNIIFHNWHDYGRSEQTGTLSTPSSGKMFYHYDGSWKGEVFYPDQTITDSSIEIRFTRPKGWGNHTVRLHTYNAGKDGTTWPGYAMTYLWDNDYGETVWSWSPSASEPLYGNIIFNNDNSGSQSSTIDAPSSSTTYWNGGSSSSDSVDQMNIYLYDYDNVYNGTVTAHATRGMTSFAGDFAGSKEVAHSRIYKFTFSNRYNNVTFAGAGGTHETSTLTTSGNYVYVLANDSTVLDGKGTWWDNINYALAHDIAQNYLLLRPTTEGGVSTDDYSSTQYCSARFNNVKSYIQELDSIGMLEFVWPQLTSGFTAAVERLSEWARINGESLNTTNGSLTPVNSGRILMDILNSSNDGNSATTTAIIVATALSAVAVGGYFYLRKREN